MISKFTISREGHGSLILEVEYSWELPAHPYKRVGDQILPYGPSYLTICGRLVKTIANESGLFQIEGDRADLEYSLREECIINGEPFESEISGLRFLTISGSAPFVNWYEMKPGDIIIIQGFFNYDNVQKYWKYFENEDV